MTTETANIVYNSVRTSNTIVQRALHRMDPEWEQMLTTHPLATLFHEPILWVRRSGMVNDPSMLEIFNASGAFADLYDAVHRSVAGRGHRLLWHHTTRGDYHYAPYRYPKAVELYERGAFPLEEPYISTMLKDRYVLRQLAMSRRDWISQYLSFHKKMHRQYGAWRWGHQPHLAHNVDNLAQFIDSMERFAAFIDANSIMTLYHEDFVTDPDTHLQTLCAHFGMSFDPNWRDKLAETDISWGGGDIRAKTRDGWEGFTPNATGYNLDDFSSDFRAEIEASGWIKTRTGWRKP